MPLKISDYEISRDSLSLASFWHSPNNSCAPHFHSSIEIVFVKSGIMEANISGSNYKIGKDELLVVPSYSVHQYSTPKKSDTLVMIVPLSYIPSFQKLLTKKTFAKCHIKNPAINNEVARCIEMCCDIAEVNSDSLVIRGYINVIMALLIENIELQEINKNEDSALVRNILNYIHQNYKNNLTLSSLSKEFGYSSSRFSHIFNQQIGSSISEYINALRCRQVATILIEGELSITEVALLVGFNSIRTFYRSFFRVFGVSPKEYIATFNKNETLKHAGSEYV